MQNRRILIIDDNQSLHDDFKKIFLKENSEQVTQMNALEEQLFGAPVAHLPGGLSEVTFELDHALQGEEGYKKALQAYREGRPYAMAFVDMRMPPGWDGVTTIEKICQHVPNMEFVICTAYSEYSLEQIVQRLGISNSFLFLKKPFESAEVQQMALALTTKWNLNEKNQRHVDALEQLIVERTKELDLQRAYNMHSAKFMALGEMAGGIAHEINSPLAAIHLYADLAKEILAEGADKNEKVTELIDNISSVTDQISKIIRGLRIYTHRGEEDPFYPTAVNQLIQNVLNISQEKFRQGNVRLTVEEFDPRLSIECRETQICQVLLNLLNNSFDAIENTNPAWVNIGVKDLGAAVEIHVTDSGSGIPADVQAKLFQPFFTTKGAGKGTGIGLSISKTLIESHHGELRIQNGPNTCFVISLPKFYSKKTQKAG